MNAPVNYLSFKQTLKALDCSKNFVWQLIYNGTLKRYKLGGKLYFKVDEIERAMTQVQEKSL